MPLPFDESAGLTAPSAFGTYRVLHQIGSGVLGPVFRTYDPQRDRLVAVKAFRLEILPEQVARLADALRRLAAPGVVPDHPNLVPALDAGLEGTTAYLASDYVVAETLDVALRHLAPAPLDRALPILEQMADAIDAAWTAGVGHGALHPRDVFVTVDSHDVRLTGAGVIQAIESVDAKAPIRRPYTAPERANGDPWDVRADVYALGAIAHELLTRRRPAGAGEQDGALTTGTSPEQRVQIRRVLSAVLAERPEHRFQSARAFTDALAAIARGEAPAAWPEAPAVAGPDAVDDLRDERPPDERTPDEVAELPVVIDAPAEPVEVAPLRVDFEAGEAASAPFEPRAPEPAPAAAAAEAERTDDALFENPVDGPLDFGQSPVSELEREDEEAEDLEDAPPVPLPARTSSFPWTALTAVAAAGIAVGIVVGYQFGQRARAPAPAFVASAETEVPVPLEPAVDGDAAAPALPRADTPRLPVAGEDGGAPPVARASAQLGRLVVRSTPSGALVVIDGRPHGQTPITVPDVPLGRHAVEVARSGFVPYRTALTLTSDAASRTLSVRLQAGLPTTDGVDDSTRGSMFVDSRPQAARVILDGRYVGMTPLRLPDVVPGRHVVSLERAGYASFSTTVGVRAGEQARVTAGLEERR